MRTMGWWRSCCRVLLLAVLTGCGNDPEDTCAYMCEFASRCSEDESVDCSKNGSQMNACVDELEQLSGGCQDALGDFYECVDDVNSCGDELSRECGSEAGDVIEECAGEDALD